MVKGPGVFNIPGFRPLHRLQEDQDMINHTKESVVERLAIFGIECLGEEVHGQWNCLKFKFPKREVFLIIPHPDDNITPYFCEIKDGAIGKNLYDFEVYITADSIVHNGIQVTVLFNFFSYPNIEIKSESDQNQSSVKTRLKIKSKHQGVQIACYNFCQGNMPVGVFLDYLRENIEKLGI